MDLSALVSRRVIPVITLSDHREANVVGDALAGGGLPIAEVTLRTPVALDAVEILAARGDLLVGVGSVTRPAQVDAAARAGARFIVSPGINAAVVAHARSHALPVLPGVATASEIMLAISLGLNMVKLFPAAVFGGPDAILALSAAFPHMGFVPTGGITASAAEGYLRLPSVRAVGGSWMLPSEAVAAHDLDTLVSHVRAAARVGAGTAAGTTSDQIQESPDTP